MSTHPGFGGNGVAGATAQTVQINPVEIASVLLTFLHRRRLEMDAERAAVDQCEMLLQALRTGAIVIATAERPPAEPPGQPGNGEHA